VVEQGKHDARGRLVEGHTNLVVANRHGLETALRAASDKTRFDAETTLLATPFVCLVSQRKKRNRTRPMFFSAPRLPE
jgi:hypothetical protein